MCVEELDSRRTFAKDLTKKVYCLCEADTFFESDLKVIKKSYLPKQANTKSVAQLLYEFFYFYTYEFDPALQLINIKQGEDGPDGRSKKDNRPLTRPGFSLKQERDRFPFSIVDPFDSHRNPGSTVKFHSPGHKKIQAQFRAALDKFVVEGPKQVPRP